MRKILFFQKRIKLFNVKFMATHVNDHVQDKFAFVNFPASSNAMSKLIGMDNNNVQPTAHKAVEMFFKFIVVLFPGDTARSRCTFLAMTNNLKLTNINGGRNTAMRTIKNTGLENSKLYPKLICMTVVVICNIARRVSSLRLVTDVR